jgi:CDP-diacylglycerol--glycerol-3-phosphate 3-phosphatidyltransferase
VRSFVATLIYLGGAVSDMVDGWLARRRKQVSVLGKFLDPLADKLMVSSVLVYLTAMDRVPAWLTVALLAREFAVTTLRAIASAEGIIIAAKEGGKQKTALQLIGTMFCLLHFSYPVWGLENVTIADEPLRINFHMVGIVTLGLSLVMSVFSGVEYFMGFVRAVQAHVKKDAPPPP